MEEIRCVKCKRLVISVVDLPAGTIAVRRCIACCHSLNMKMD